MGIAAYNRGSHVIKQHGAVDENLRNTFELMNMLNALPKVHSDKVINQVLNTRVYMPFTRGAVSYSHGVFWLENTDYAQGKGFSYWYKTLKALVTAWDISLVDYDASKNIFYVENNKS
jgi:hypothetical protein